MDERSFPAPWRFEEFSDGYRVLDADNRVLAYVLASDHTAEDPRQLTREEALRVARVIASLPDLIKEGPGTEQTQHSWWKWLTPRSN